MYIPLRFRSDMSLFSIVPIFHYIRNLPAAFVPIATLRVYQCLKDKLQDRAEVVDYRKIADEVGMSWNGVKYAVSALIRYGFIKKEGGKLSVNPSSPEVVGDYRTEAGG